MIPKTDGFILSTGKEFYANNCIVGLSLDLDTYEGRDGGIDDDEFTRLEHIEIAEFMIALWYQYRNKFMLPLPEDKRNQRPNDR